MRLQIVSALLLISSVLSRSALAEGQTPGPESPSGPGHIVALALARSPELRAAEQRMAVARARLVGADASARDNPVLSLLGGPRRLVDGEVIPDVIVGLSWPLDVAGVAPRRVAVADAGVRIAEAEAQGARLRVAYEALTLWLSAVSATRRGEVSRRQLEVDQTAARIARVRFERGVAAQDEVALTSLRVAATEASLSVYEGAQRAAVAELRARLSLSEQDLTLMGASIGLGDPPSLQALRAGLASRPDLLRAGLEVELARRDTALQQRLGWPVPRVSGSLGRENEYYGRVGLDLPLPVYQRNRTAIAVAEAQREASRAESLARVRSAEAQLLAAWERHQAASRARRVLDSARGAIEELERWVTRAFELGQRDLAAVVLSLREAARAREALCEAHIAEAEALLALHREGGVLP